MTMLMVNIADMKAKLSEYLDAAARGEQVIICNRNQPVAELRAIAQPRRLPRDLSPMYPGETFMADTFFDPMPADELEQWYGPDRLPAKVAGKGPSDGKTAKPAKRKKRS